MANQNPSFIDFINPVASGVGAVGNIVGNLINNHTQEKLLDKQIQAQKDLQSSQNDFNFQMWQANNEYNSPSNQRALFENAGLNPALFMKGSDPQSSSPASSTPMSAPTGITPHSDFSHLGSDTASIGLAMSQMYKNYKDAGLSNSQIKTEEALRDGKVRLQNVMADLNESEKKEHDQKVSNLKAEESYTKALEDLTGTQKDFLDLQIQYYPLMQEAQLLKIEEEIKKMITEEKYNEAQVNYLYASMALIRSQISLNHEYSKTEQKKRESMDQQISESRQNIEESKSRVGVNQSIERENDAKAHSLELDNEVREDTKGSEVARKNIENYTAPVIDLIHEGVDAVSKVKGISINTSHARSHSRDASTHARAQRHRERMDEMSSHQNPGYSGYESTSSR